MYVITDIITVITVLCMNIGRGNDGGLSYVSDAYFVTILLFIRAWDL